MAPRRRLQQADILRLADLIRRRGGDHYVVTAQFAQAKGLAPIDRLRIARQVAQQKAIGKVLKKR